LNNLGLVYFSKAKKMCFKTSMTDRERNDMENKRVTLLDLALSYFERDLKYTKQALKDQEKRVSNGMGTSYNVSHHDIAKTLNNMALVYASQGDTKKSYELSQKALDAKLKEGYGEAQISLGNTRNNIALLYEKYGTGDLLEGNAIVAASKGDEQNPKELDKYESSLSNLENALYNFEKDMNVLSTTLGSGHFLTLKAQRQVERCKSEINKVVNLKESAYSKVPKKSIVAKLIKERKSNKQSGEMEGEKDKSSKGKLKLTDKTKLIKELMEEEKKTREISMRKPNDSGSFFSRWFTLGSYNSQ